MKTLNGVSQTLLIPLYARFLETQRDDAIIRDEKSSEIIKQLNLDFSQFSKTIWSTQVGIAIRTEILDREVSNFLKQNPAGIVVNLGAGLCTRFFRVDNGLVKWFELDLEPVKQLWEQVFTQTERHRYLAYSLFDFSWIDEIKLFEASPILFIAEGLLFYFEESEVKKIIITIKNHFPGSEMLIEAIGLSQAKNTQKHPVVSKTDVVFKWGIQAGKDLEQWDKDINFINEWYYYDRYGSRWRWYRFYKYIPSLRKGYKIFHIKFNK